mgnify:CR=1 FL=1
MIYLSLFLFLLAALCNGIMDAIKDKFSITYFSNMRNIKLRRWLMSFWLDKYEHRKLESDKFVIKTWFWKIKKPFFLWDGWHFFKTLFIILLIINIFIAPYILSSISKVVLLFFIYWALWGIGFNLMYEVFLIQKKFRRNYFKIFWGI